MQYNQKDYEMPHAKAWCPGCGNFGLFRSLREALAELEIPPQHLVMVSGIGQAAKLPQYTHAHMFNTLHGRALPAAMAIKAVNPEMTVIVNSGDGCIYGEGGNHFLAQIQRNSDIVNIVHNNMVYGLTKGQASPTSLKGMKTKVHPEGVFNEPFNPLAVAIAMGATFVARVYQGNREQTKNVFKEAIQHRGYSLVDCFVECVAMNKVNTTEWYREHTYKLEESHNIHDRTEAFKRSIEVDPYPTGIFYKEEGKPVFWEQCTAYRDSKEPLYQRMLDHKRLRELIATFK
ncbi:MAG: 2-oxoglutarate/2-oxoacid ferredoxin oxidoreductase subunit beta [Candidatus Methanomethylophilaceae archaeon]|nr:2-oxoglutarate/2-oxoacid ferredoxin oxidoreductase subunit beta [Candidatus Methanomethylophilaceae archaeon]